MPHHAVPTRRGQITYGEALLRLTQLGHTLHITPRAVDCHHCGLHFDAGPRYPFSPREIERPCQEERHARLH